MGLSDAVKSVFSKYATFSGRASRSEYWYFVLFNFLLSLCLFVVCALLGAVFGKAEGAVGGFAIAYVLNVIYGLAALLPGLAVCVRRLHDTGRSGWNYFFCLIPVIGAIILLVFFLTDSQPGTNEYGPNPHTSGSGHDGLVIVDC